MEINVSGLSKGCLIKFELCPNVLPRPAHAITYWVMARDGEGVVEGAGDTGRVLEGGDYDEGDRAWVIW